MTNPTTSTGPTHWGTLENFLTRPYDLVDKNSKVKKIGMTALCALAYVGTLFILPITVGLHHGVKYLKEKFGDTAAKVDLLATPAKRPPDGKAADEALDKDDEDAIFAAYVKLPPEGKAAVDALDKDDENAIPLCVDAIIQGHLPTAFILQAAESRGLKIPEEMLTAIIAKEAEGKLDNLFRRVQANIYFYAKGILHTEQQRPAQRHKGTS